MGQVTNKPQAMEENYDPLDDQILVKCTFKPNCQVVRVVLKLMCCRKSSQKSEV